MSISALRIGTIDTIKQQGLALRDIERKINDIIRQLPAVVEAGSTHQFLALGSDGQWHAWTLVSGGGCTITFNDATHVCTISVP